MCYSISLLLIGVITQSSEIKKEDVKVNDFEILNVPISSILVSYELSFEKLLSKIENNIDAKFSSSFPYIKVGHVINRLLRIYDVKTLSVEEISFCLNKKRQKKPVFNFIKLNDFLSNESDECIFIESSNSAQKNNPEKVNAKQQVSSNNEYILTNLQKATVHSRGSNEFNILEKLVNLKEMDRFTNSKLSHHLLEFTKLFFRYLMEEIDLELTIDLLPIQVEQLKKVRNRLLIMIVHFRVYKTRVFDKALFKFSLSFKRFVNKDRKEYFKALEYSFFLERNVKQLHESLDLLVCLSTLRFFFPERPTNPPMGLPHWKFYYHSNSYSNLWDDIIDLYITQIK